MAYIVLFVALILSWRLKLWTTWLVGVLGLIGSMYLRWESEYVWILAFIVLVRPVFVWIGRTARRVFLDVRDRFTDDRVPMPRELRQKVWQQKGRRCVYCGAPAQHLDHVRPYWWLKEHGYPLHTYDNLVPACARCNLMVRGRVFDSFEEKQAWIQARLGLYYRESPWARLYRTIGGQND